MPLFHTSDYLALLSSLLACDSSNPPGRTRESASAAAAYLGFELRENRLIRSGQAPLSLEGRVLALDNERPQLLFFLKGRREEGGLALTGHLDVVPVDEEERARWASDPFVPTLKDGRLYGRGSCDMKGGVAAALMALRHAAEAADLGQLPEENLALLLTADEEGDMRGSERLLEDAEVCRFRQLIVCEPTSLVLCSSGRGRIYGSIRLHGSGGHGSRGTEGNLIQQAARLVERFAAEDFSAYSCPDGAAEGPSFWQFLAIHAEKDPCVLPDRVDLIWDARLTPDHPCHDILNRLESLKQEQSWGSARLEYQVHDRREGWRMAQDSTLRSRILSALSAVNRCPEEGTFPGTTDGSKLRRCGIEVAILGPGSLEQAHRPNEFIDLREGCLAAELYARLMQADG